MIGVFYKHPFLYQIAVRLIYGRDFRKRYEFVAKYINKGWRILDLCCGDCYLKKVLDDAVKYEGWDFNARFIRRARNRGIEASYCDLRKEPKVTKKYDCVVMMSSLYHFIPAEDRVIEIMKSLGSKRVIITETIKTPSLSKNKLISLLAKITSNAGNQKVSEMKRFSRDDLIKMFRRHGVTQIIDWGMDIFGVFDL